MQRELVVRFETDMKTEGKFYTENNGLEFRERQYNASFDPDTVALNYYPMVARAFINDSDARLAFVSDRTHGTTSIQEGHFEIMLHRRCAADDGKGVGEVSTFKRHIF